MDRRLGFIGLGNMGMPIASRLAAAGYELTVFDVRRDAIDALRAKGARPAASPAEVASASTTVLLSLPTPGIVREVVLGGHGVVAGAAVETVLDLSTTGAATAREIAATLTAKGVTAVDAPVSGGVAGAIAGTLAVMVACPRPTFDAVAPLLGHLGRVFFVGERPGMGPRSMSVPPVKANSVWMGGTLPGGITPTRSLWGPTPSTIASMTPFERYQSPIPPSVSIPPKRSAVSPAPICCARGKRAACRRR
jgi:hypothetical protein